MTSLSGSKRQYCVQEEFYLAILIHVCFYSMDRREIHPACLSFQMVSEEVVQLKGHVASSSLLHSPPDLAHKDDLLRIVYSTDHNQTFVTNRVIPGTEFLYRYLF